MAPYFYLHSNLSAFVRRTLMFYAKDPRPGDMRTQVQDRFSQFFSPEQKLPISALTLSQVLLVFFYPGLSHNQILPLWPFTPLSDGGFW